jgi:hypothetical protein
MVHQGTLCYFLQKLHQRYVCECKSKSLIAMDSSVYAVHRESY